MMTGHSAVEMRPSRPAVGCTASSGVSVVEQGSRHARNVCLPDDVRLTSVFVVGGEAIEERHVVCSGSRPTKSCWTGPAPGEVCSQQRIVSNNPETSPLCLEVNGEIVDEAPVTSALEVLERHVAKHY